MHVEYVGYSFYYFDLTRFVINIISIMPYSLGVHAFHNKEAILILSCEKSEIIVILQ